MFALSAADFPLYSIGALVYRKTESSPLLTASSDFIASDIAARLNRDHFASLAAFARPESGAYVGGGLRAVRS